jgi:hypothetical protein
MAQRKALNDLVEDIHRNLFGDTEYLALLAATHDAEAVEGSLFADDLEAATRIRAYAAEHAIAEVAQQNKSTIVKSLRVVLRRYGCSRSERLQYMAVTNGTTDRR